MILQVYFHPHDSDGCLLINGPMLNTLAFAVFVSRVGDIECSDSCKFSKDGSCDDGGSGSASDFCAFATDCEVGLPECSFQINRGFVSALSSSCSTFSF
jgi:hypothetical protein